MEITRETVLEWLDANRRGQKWLAGECGVSEQAVSNWLRDKNPRPISSAARIIIGRLMEEDAARSQAVPPHNLVMEFSDDEYAPIEKAALANRMTIREWAKSILNEAASLDVESFASKIVPMKSAGNESEHWIDLRGAVAAGAPIEAVAEDSIPSPREYPEDHYALLVCGQSMEPKIRDGSIIVVKQHPRDRGYPKKGTIVVYSDGSGSTLKEFGYRKAKGDEERDSMGNVPVLRSLNKAFPDVQAMDGGRIDAVFVESLK